MEQVLKQLQDAAGRLRADRGDHNRMLIDHHNWLIEQTAAIARHDRWLAEHEAAMQRLEKLIERLARGSSSNRHEE